MVFGGAGYLGRWLKVRRVWKILSSLHATMHYRVLHHLLKKLMLIRSDFPHCENLSILTDFIFYDKFSDNDDNRLSRLRSL